MPASWRRVALDFRGHGRSSHLPPGAGYGLDGYLADVELALDGLELSAVHLVGHSMGGAIGLAYCASRPERIRSLTLIESLGSPGGPPDLIVGRLARYLDDLKKPKLKRSYPSVEEAAARVRENNSGLSEATALHLARFGVQQTPEGYQFTFDPAVRRPWGTAPDEEQILALLAAVRCPAQIIHGTLGYTLDDEQAQQRLARLRAAPPIAVEGGHHVHMDRPDEVAAHLARFITAAERRP